jgi:hypothetical protein
MSDAKEDRELAEAWLRGEGELIDDLAALVDGMTRPLDPAARTFLQTIGNAAKAAAKREARPTPSARRTPAPPPPAEPPPAAPIDLNEMIRRRQAREHARRLEEFGRSNAAAWRDQAEMVRGMGAGVDWG